MCELCVHGCVCLSGWGVSQHGFQLVNLGIEMLHAGIGLVFLYIQ